LINDQTNPKSLIKVKNMNTAAAEEEGPTRFMLVKNSEARGGGHEACMMNKSHRAGGGDENEKRRTNVGCLIYVSNAKKIEKIKATRKEEILEFDPISGFFIFPSSTANVPSENNSTTSLLKTGGVTKDPMMASLDIALSEVVCGMNRLCESVADSVLSVIDYFPSIMTIPPWDPFLWDLSATDNQNNNGSGEKSTDRPLTDPPLIENNGVAAEPSLVTSPAESKDAISPVELKDTSSEEENSHENLPEWELIEREDLGVETDKKFSINGNIPRKKKNMRHYLVPDDALVLFITSRTDPGQLVLPKGGLHRGESQCCGALRESWEEAGVLGTCKQKITLLPLLKVTRKDNSVNETQHNLEETMPNKKDWVWFLAKVNKIYDDWPEKSQRKRYWVHVRDLKKLTNVRSESKLVVDSFFPF